MILTLFLILYSFVWINPILQLIFKRHRIPFLQSNPNQIQNLALPKLSVIITGRNEEQHIETALQTILNQDYPSLEIIVVNDRSTDQTGSIIDRVAQQDAHIKPVHIHKLSPGWIGKPRALDLGSKIATGELLLFLDADICFSPSLFRQAVSTMIQESADHLTILPTVDTKRWLARCIGACYASMVVLSKRVWNINVPRSKEFIGIGAFNLVTKKAYVKIGGFQKLKMEISDDYGLGYLLNADGYRTVFALSQEVRLEWISKASDIFRVLEKDGFTGFGYKISLAVLIISVLFFLAWLPVFGLLYSSFFQPGLLNMVLSLGIFILILVYYRVSRLGYPLLTAFFFPIALSLISLSLMRSISLTLRNGGIRWRGTFYSLNELRRGQAFPKEVRFW